VFVKLPEPKNREIRKEKEMSIGWLLGLEKRGTERMDV